MHQSLPVAVMRVTYCLGAFLEMFIDEERKILWGPLVTVDEGLECLSSALDDMDELTSLIEVCTNLSPPNA